jgi:hypothetical protein
MRCFKLNVLMLANLVTEITDVAGEAVVKSM